MADSNGRARAVHHLRQALESEVIADKDYHVKEALQLLDAEETLS
jgi:hypothetical protein